MKILFFTHEKQYGGASRALVTLIDELLKRKQYKIFVVVPFKDSKIIEELKQRNVEVISCFYSWWQIPKNISKFKKIMFRIAYRGNFISIMKLKKKIKKMNIDVIHSNTSVIDVGAKVAKQLGIKHVWHFREFTGKHLSFIKKDPYKFINNNTDRVIYISKSIQSFYNNNIDKKISRLVYDGVPSNFIIKKDYKIPDEIKFLLVGTLEENKGQKLAIDAANFLNENCISNFKLILAGGNPNNYKSELEEMIDNYNLKNIVDFAGFVKDIKKLRKEVDVELMCAPSEAFGLVTVEGMLAGNVVIGSNSGATPEIIGENNKLLYQLNNYKDLANKMKYIISNKDKIKSIGIELQKKAINNFSSKQHCDNVISIYEELGSDNFDISKN